MYFPKRSAKLQLFFKEMKWKTPRAIRSIDGVVNGRGISFSWVNGYLIAKGKHKIELECYKYAKFRKNFSYNSIYSKVVTIDVVPGVNYAIETQPDKQSFYISRTLDKRR